MKVSLILIAIAACFLIGLIVPSGCSMLLPIGAVVLLDEERLSLNQLAREEGVAPSTVWRWTLRGIRGIRLEAFSVAGRRYTTREAFSRWVAATNADRDGRPLPNPTSKRRSREVATAEQELKAAGI